MENNEDNRKHTVIAAEIKTLKLKLGEWESRRAAYPENSKYHNVFTGQILAGELFLSVLESLLPKEKEQRKSDWIDGFKDGAVFNCAMECHPDDFGFDADKAYNEKYPNHGK